MTIKILPARARRGTTLICAIACAAISPSASAQTGTAAYPEKSIRLIVPFAAGGALDVVGRIVGQKMTESWGKQIVIDNRLGAGGRTRAVNRVPACGMRTSASRETRR